MEVTAAMLRKVRAAVEHERPDDIAVCTRGKYYPVDSLGWEVWPYHVGSVVGYAPGAWLVQWDPESGEATALEAWESPKQWAHAQADEDDSESGNVVLIAGWTIGLDGKREPIQVINAQQAELIRKSIVDD